MDGRTRNLDDPVSALADAIGEIADSKVELERPADSEHGDYATNVALRLAPTRRQAPRELAAEIAEKAVARGLAERAEAAGPGFVNVHVSDGWIIEALAAILDAGERFGAGHTETPQHIQVEMVSANPTGPLTVASARNGAYGDSVARLLELAGDEVEREYYYNDAGTQMERFHASVEALRRGDEPPADGYRGEYVAELAKLDGDPGAEMLRRIEASLERFRIHFDTWARQSELQQRLPEFLPRLDTYESDGALWARSSEYGDEQDRVLIRSNGEPTYRAADVPYVDDKLSRGFDRAIYVLGADHQGARHWYAAIAKMLEYDPGRVEVLIYQLVHLTKGGARTKMAKRSGDIVFLDELVDEVGIDAARWYLVSRGPDQTIDIDVDLAAQRTQKNPVYYVQYAHARIAGILRNAAGVQPGSENRVGRPGVAEPELRITDIDPSGALAAEERDLVKRLLEFPALAAEAAERRAPQGIPMYAIRVADDFHRFYHHHRVLGTPEQGFRLALCVATRRVIARCLDLVGVQAPDRM